jgi:DNA-binding response OmpR family regulator
VLTPVIRSGDLEIDLLHRQVRIGRRDLHLTPLELGLLYLLMANAGRTLTRDEILNNVWGANFVAESNVVDRHVRNLRAKLDDDWRRPRYIATVPGQGYRFVHHGADSLITRPCHRNDLEHSSLRDEELKRTSTA